MEAVAVVVKFNSLSILKHAVLLHRTLCPGFFRWKKLDEMLSKIWLNAAPEIALSVFTCCHLIILWFGRGSHSVSARWIELFQDFNYFEIVPFSIFCNAEIQL